MKQKQAGFTLIEIAIVLVIIGLILGGVLKGQEMITNGKLKSVTKDLDGITTAVNVYVDRYRRTPGDDGPLATLQARGGAWTAITNAGNNNGVLAITAAQTFTAGGEGVAFWQHLKSSGLITGNVTDVGVAALPRHAFGGLIGVTGVGVTGMTGNVVCLSQMPGQGAQAIDTQIDDGVPSSGAVRATQGAVGANTAPGAAEVAYSEDNVYTVCRNF